MTEVWPDHCTGALGGMGTVYKGTPLSALIYRIAVIFRSRGVYFADFAERAQFANFETSKFNH